MTTKHKQNFSYIYGNMKRFIITILSIICFLSPSYAQFYVEGNERTSIKWSTFNTNSYKFIYPRGCDSLAFCYARQWEKYRYAVGYGGGDNLPVVLHPYSSISNGFVVWTPSRMEMFAAPSMYSPEAVPWHTLLAIHENRHVAQMQFMQNRHFKWTEYVFGELLSGPISVLWCSSMFMEGDAVATETALTQSGRGRSADFLEYFRVCFENGDLRDFDRWRFGSQKYYTPDYYKIGYLSVAGMGAGPHTEFFDNTFRHRFSGFAKRMQRHWQEDTRSRAPFQQYTQLTENEKYYVSYSGLAVKDGQIYALRTGIADNARLVSIDPESGEVENLCYASPESRLSSSGDRLYWTEEVPNLRWEMHSSSALRSYDGRKIRTEIGGHRLYNPAWEEDRLALVENEINGECKVRVYKRIGHKLSEINVYDAPSGVQVLEPVWANGHLYASAMDDSGQFLCDIERGCLAILASSPVKINHLFSKDGKLLFTSDRTGVNELYSLDPKSGEVYQLTNLPQGGKDFVFNEDKLYFTVLSPMGRNVCETPTSSLSYKKVNFNVRHSYVLADSLSRAVADVHIGDFSDATWEVRPYSKFKNAFRFHSFIPFLFLDSDEMMTISSEQQYMNAGLGATAFFQNNLSTLYGNVGLKFFEDENGLPLPGLGFNLKYRGLYPIIELKGMYVDNYSYGYLRSYIPFNLSRNGWSTGIIPVVSLESKQTGKSWSWDSSISAGIRAYTMLPKCNSNVFPRWGIGISLEDSYSFTTHRFKPAMTLYGYTPGIKKTHGFAWNVSYLQECIETQEYVALIDRMGVNIRYAFSIPIDWSGLSPLFYLRNMELIPFYEFSNDNVSGFRMTDRNFFDGYLNQHSAGTYINAVLGNMFCLPYDFRVGVKVGYNTEDKMFCKLVLSYDM